LLLNKDEEKLWEVILKMKTRFYYLQWPAALMVFIGLPLHARYENLISTLLVFMGVLLTLLFGFLDKRKKKRIDS